MGRVTSFSDLVTLCFTHATKFTTKLKSITSSKSSPAKSSKSLASIVSNKAMKLVQRKKTNQNLEDDNIGFGDGGVWQRSILMGDKCQPLDFSGVIYYDGDGKQLTGVPLRSPRASPLPAYLVSAGRERV